MPANCSCHPVEVPYKNDRAGHRPPSSPLATPPSWGDVTPAATALASIWAQIYVQVCVPVTCQKSCISQKKDARRQAFQIQRQTQTSAAELNPKSWNKGAVLALCIWETRQKKKQTSFVSYSPCFEKSHPNTSSLLFAVHRGDFHTHMHKHILRLQLWYLHKNYGFSTGRLVTVAALYGPIMSIIFQNKRLANQSEVSSFSYLKMKNQSISPRLSSLNLVFITGRMTQENFLVVNAFFKGCTKCYFLIQVTQITSAWHTHCEFSIG